MFLLELAVIVVVAVGVGIALGRFAIPVGLLVILLGMVPMGCCTSTRGSFTRGVTRAVRGCCRRSS
jgi:Kef-type K+ transport system membrane component KefB